MTSRRPVRDLPSGPLVTTLVTGAALLTVYLLTAPSDTSGREPSDDCTDRVVYHAARLRDC